MKAYDQMHTLVVGGTGMLAGATKWLAKQGHVVTVISRRAFNGEWAGVNPLTIDYRESEMLQKGIAEAISAHGPIHLAVFWIHTDAADAFRVIAEEISAHAKVSWRLFHVRGSATHLHLEAPLVPPNCLYRQVVLGFVEDENGSRWLTHDEISGGVIEAIRCDREQSTVGTLEPWEKRPV